MTKRVRLSPAVAPYLSVVAASRNDNHGGDPLIRTQIFINNFARQCEKYQLPAELIIVDWNPVADRPSLAAVLSVPSEATQLKARTITVPGVLHRRLKYSEQLQFFQMIAKNVGIRRAKGQFVLATNIDILFSEELIRFIAQQRIDPQKLYRADRYDIESGLTLQATLDETMSYAWSHPIRAHRRYNPESLIQHLYGVELFKRSCHPSQQFQGKCGSVEILEEGGVWQIRPEHSAKMDHLHTNGCGDFTLLSREGWSAIRGYPEFEAFSFNIDSIGVVAAHYAGYQEVSLLPPCVCFHIEHGIGSGWTPEGEKQLFSRLEKAGILNPEWPVLTPLVDEMRKGGRALEFNSPNWGLADIELPERMLGDATPMAEFELERVRSQASTHPVSSIQPGYDLDRLTLLHERRHGPAVYDGPDLSRVVLYVPDANGKYSEQRSIYGHIGLFQRHCIELSVDEFPVRNPLRFDPCPCHGLVTIYSMKVLDKNKKVLWELNSHNVDQLIAKGTATMPSRWVQNFQLFRKADGHRQLPLRILSTGVDPQLILPVLTGHIEFPVVISAEMSIAPVQ